MVCDEGEGLQGFTVHPGSGECRDIGSADHLAPPEDFGFRFEVLPGDAIGKAFASIAMVKRRHQAGDLAGAAGAPGVLEDEPAGIVGQPGTAHLGEQEGGVPHQRAIGKDPQVAIAMLFQHLPAGRLALRVPNAVHPAPNEAPGAASKPPGR